MLQLYNYPLPFQFRPNSLDITKCGLLFTLSLNHEDPNYTSPWNIKLNISEHNMKSIKVTSECDFDHRYWYDVWALFRFRNWVQTCFDCFTVNFLSFLQVVLVSAWCVCTLWLSNFGLICRTLELFKQIND